MSRRTPSPLRRVRAVRLAMVCVVVAVIVLAFTNLLGPFRIIFRGVVVLGVAVIVLSYLVEWWLKRGRRASEAGR